MNAGHGLAVSRVVHLERRAVGVGREPAQGVARVEGLEEKVIMNAPMRFYVLRVLDSDKKIMVPEGKVDSVDIRRVISADEVDEVFDILRERNVSFDH